jgi:16S rRNA (guanine966-N2)-methyltransferase
MRIVGGEYRGRTLESPEGKNTRPTGDRVRESVFNILRHAGWLKTPVLENALVLDVFAGTGALGLEAFSQGAAHVAFMEQDRIAAAVCRRNIAQLHAGEQSRLFMCNALTPPPRPADVAPRTLVFLDPPYGKGLGAQALMALVRTGWLAEDVVCILEMAKKQQEETPPGFDMQDERAYGIALVRFMVLKAFS